MHARTSLTYDLQKRFDRFQAIVGFENTQRDLGNVDIRVVGDGRDLLTISHHRAVDAPREIDLDVTDVQQLQLITDFGGGQDVEDRVIWADARLRKRR